MATSTQICLSSSTFFCTGSISSKPIDSACRSTPVATPNRLVICHQDNKRTEPVDVSRRSILGVAAASAAAFGLNAQPEAQAAGRRKPAVEEKKEEKVDEGLSAYDQRLLANARRKDAMKASVEAVKAKAKSVATKE